MRARLLSRPIRTAAILGVTLAGAFLSVGAVAKATAHRASRRNVKPVSLASAAPVSRTGDSPLPLAESSVQAAGSASSAVVIDMAAIEAEIRRHHGHPVILHFWASWCGPCLAELPLMNDLAKRVRAKGAEVLSVSLDDPEKRADHVLSLLRQQAPALTAAIARIDDPDRFIATFHGVRGQRWEGSIPALFAYDRKGTLTRQLLGEASPSELEALVRGAGVKAPGAARAVARKTRVR